MHDLNCKQLISCHIQISNEANIVAVIYPPLLIYHKIESQKLNSQKFSMLHVPAFILQIYSAYTLHFTMYPSFPNQQHIWHDLLVNVSLIIYLSENFFLATPLV